MSEFTKIGGGHTRRTSLMYPTDLWPNGVEIPIESGLFEIYPHYAMWNSEDEMVYTENNWSFVVIPIKLANCIVIRNTRLEYTYYLTEDKKKIRVNLYNSNLGNYSYRYDRIPLNAKYIGCTCRSATASEILKGVTFYYLPTSNAEINVIFQQVRHDRPDDSYTVPFIPCHGYTKLYISVNARGQALWYGEDKNYLFTRGYGTESSIYNIPEGAYYVKLQTYILGNIDQNPKGTAITYWLE